MKRNPAREAILKVIRGGEKHPSSTILEEYAMTKPAFQDFSAHRCRSFAEQFSLQGGKYFHCPNEQTLKDNLTSLFSYRNWEKIPVYGEKLFEYLSSLSISVVQGNKSPSEDLGCCQCRYLISSTGGIVLTTNQEFGIHLKTLPKKLIVIAFSTQLVDTTWDVYHAFSLQPVPHMLTLTPSTHKDFGIEELYVFLSDRSPRNP